MNDIVITGARMHNLKGIDVTIPRNSLTVVTGLSGSGKSSLAFDTLYAEGQRRYVESLSAYARQFLDRMAKPEVEKIEGLSPAISIEQHTTSGNPRSIVATVTEIHDYLRILYGSIAVPHCPKCGKPVTRQSAEQIVDSIMRLAGAKLILYAPVVKGKKGRHEEVFATLRRNGFARVRIDGTVYPLEEVPQLDKKKSHNIEVVVDRLVIPQTQRDEPAADGSVLPRSKRDEPAADSSVYPRSQRDEQAADSSVYPRSQRDEPAADGSVYPRSKRDEPAADGSVYPRSKRDEPAADGSVYPRSKRDEPKAKDAGEAAFYTRLTDSVELALKTGGGLLYVENLTPDSRTATHEPRISIYSELNACPDCGISFDELKPRSFSFNSPFGACPTCAGLGQLYYFDEDLVVPDPSLPLRECIHPWRRAGHNAIMYYNALLEQIAKQYKVKLDTPYEKLPAKFRHDLMHGFKDDLVLPWRSVDRPFEGVLATLQKRLEEAEDEETRAKYEAYQSFKVCPACHGARLNEFSRAATVAGKTLTEVMAMPVKECLEFFGSTIERSVESKAKLEGLKDILDEIRKRLKFLIDVGLDYLTLDRASSTLSGGEMQRIRLATQIGSGLTGVLYVLDEPTIGLHPRDNERLIATLKELRDRGNTVVIVEHDEEMMRAADYIVDLGPGAGREGGQLMYQGNFKGLLKAKSLTADYLTGRKQAAFQSTNRKLDKAKTRFLTIANATAHNLKHITAHIPVGSLTVVTGVSGSGKSSLVNETLKPLMLASLKRKGGAARKSSARNSKGRRGDEATIKGVEHFDKLIEIDQSPIGRTPRSNPATYVGFFSEIRELFAKTEAAKARGYTAGRFSFNVKGGRCEVCGGDGVQKLEMSFLPDVYVTCEQCGGKRFNAETLEVTYGGKNIAEVLEMTVAEAVEFFGKVPSLARKLKTLDDVGLGYLALGQAATTLSGGEAQRIKLATELSRRATGKTLYLLDEPTTGLHFDDVAKLLRLLIRLRDQGNTVVVIEHNLDVIRSADWIIDLGPNGGDTGGNLVAEGSPDKIRATSASFTGRFLSVGIPRC